MCVRLAIRFFSNLFDTVLDFFVCVDLFDTLQQSKVNKNRSHLVVRDASFFLSSIPTFFLPIVLVLSLFVRFILPHIFGCAQCKMHRFFRPKKGAHISLTTIQIESYLSWLCFGSMHLICAHILGFYNGFFNLFALSLENIVTCCVFHFSSHSCVLRAHTIIFVVLHCVSCCSLWTACNRMFHAWQTRQYIPLVSVVNNMFESKVREKPSAKESKRFPHPTKCRSLSTQKPKGKCWLTALRCDRPT